MNCFNRIGPSITFEKSTFLFEFVFNEMIVLTAFFTNETNPYPLDFIVCESLTTLQSLQQKQNKFNRTGIEQDIYFFIILISYFFGRVWYVVKLFVLF